MDINGFHASSLKCSASNGFHIYSQRILAHTTMSICLPSLVYEENEMVFVSHEVPFPAMSDRRSRVAGHGTE